MESTTTTAAATDVIFCTVPASAFPPDAPPVMYVETDTRPRWIIREGAPLPEVVAELDSIATHLVHNGIWQMAGDGDTKPPSLRHVS